PSCICLLTLFTRWRNNSSFFSNAGLTLVCLYSKHGRQGECVENWAESRCSPFRCSLHGRMDSDQETWNDSESPATSGRKSAPRKSPRSSGVTPKGSTSSRKSSGAAAVNSEYMDDIKQTFARFEVRNEGKIETKQLKFAMRALGFEPKKEEIKRIADEFDRDGYILFQDFVDLMVKRLAEKSANEEIMKAFQLFDSGQTGKITFDDLKRVADELKQKLSD